MYGQWLAFEHERLHTVEHWPETAMKEATLAAIRGTITMLRSKAPDIELPECSVCRARRIRVLSVTPRDNGRVSTPSSLAA